MQGRPMKLASAALAALVLSVGMVGSVSAHRSDSRSAFWDLIRLGAETARFHSTVQATRAGYAPFPEGQPLHECISSFDNTGAMGFHWLNAGNLGPDVSVDKPQVLVYAPDRKGNLHLVAIEYVVFKADWESKHGATMPELFGRMFMSTDAPNRYAIPAFYSLHVWLWDWNPSGLFASFNPRVSCAGSTTAAAAAISANLSAAVSPAADRARFACRVAGVTA